MGKKKKQEKEKKKLSAEEKKLLKAKKKDAKTVKESKAVKADKEAKAEKLPKAAKVSKTDKKTKVVKESKLEKPVQISVGAVGDQETLVSEEAVISVREATLIFRALGDETRMEILTLLEGREMCAVELLQCVKVVQSTLSHHMKVLTESGLVLCRRDNKRVYYSISTERMKEAAVFLQHYQQQMEK